MACYKAAFTAAVFCLNLIMEVYASHAPVPTYQVNSLSSYGKVPHAPMPSYQSNSQSPYASYGQMLSYQGYSPSPYGQSSQPACVDFNVLCPAWSTVGECMMNPIWMLINCQQSCNACMMAMAVTPAAGYGSQAYGGATGGGSNAFSAFYFPTILNSTANATTISG